MRRALKIHGFHFAKKLANRRMGCNHSSDRIPNAKNCLVCHQNLLTRWFLKELQFPFMSSKERIDYLDSQIDERDKVNAIKNMDLTGLLDIKLIQEKKRLEEMHDGDTMITAALPVDEIVPDMDAKKIAVGGNKGEFGIKAGWFFFNPNNHDGLHLSKIHTEAIINLLRERFIAFDGSSFSHRYMVDKIAFGRNNDPEEDN